MIQFIRGNDMKKVENKPNAKHSKETKKIKTIKLYEALFVGASILLLLFIILYKYVTPNL